MTIRRGAAVMAGFATLAVLAAGCNKEEDTSAAGGTSAGAPSYSSGGATPGAGGAMSASPGAGGAMSASPGAGGAMSASPGAGAPPGPAGVPPGPAGARTP